MASHLSVAHSDRTLEMGDGIEHTLCAFSHEESVFTACFGSVEVGIQLTVVIGERHNILRESKGGGYRPPPL